MVLADRVHPVRYLIRDRDTTYTSDFDEAFEAGNRSRIGLSAPAR
jgi:hypothetical protein